MDRFQASSRAGVPSPPTSGGLGLSSAAGRRSPAWRGAPLPRPPSQSLSAADLATLKVPPVAAAAERPRAATAGATPWAGVGGSAGGLQSRWDAGGGGDRALRYATEPRAGQRCDLGSRRAHFAAGRASPGSQREEDSRRPVARSESDRLPGQRRDIGRRPSAPLLAAESPPSPEQLYQNFEPPRKDLTYRNYSTAGAPNGGASPPDSGESEYLEMNASVGSPPGSRQDSLHQNMHRLGLGPAPFRSVPPGINTRRTPAPHRTASGLERAAYPRMRPLRQEQATRAQSPQRSSPGLRGSPGPVTEENHYIEILDNDVSPSGSSAAGSRLPTIRRPVPSERPPVPLPSAGHRLSPFLPPEANRPQHPRPEVDSRSAPSRPLVSPPPPATDPTLRGSASHTPVGHRKLSEERLAAAARQDRTARFPHQEPSGSASASTTTEDDYLLPDGESRWGVTSPAGAVLEASDDLLKASGGLGSTVSLSELACGGGEAGSSGSGSPPGGLSAESDAGAPQLPPEEMPSQAWFRDLPRSTAELVLSGRQEGAFLVRPSRSVAGPLALSVVVAGQCRHLTIRRTADGGLMLGTRADERRFQSVAELVAHYCKHPVHVRSGGSVNATKLTWHPQGYVV